MLTTEKKNVALELLKSKASDYRRPEIKTIKEHVGGVYRWKIEIHESHYAQYADEPEKDHWRLDNCLFYVDYYGQIARMLGVQSMVMVKGKYEDDERFCHMPYMVIF